jgi:demethylmenaquinone methyltransferase/2-methoxy-6-polyprenyl-1,4-benzoquinol methylase
MAIQLDEKTRAEAQSRSLEEANPLREPVLRSAIAALNLAPGSRGLDVGCGIGYQAVGLAEAIGPGGGVLGLDLSAQLLVHARAKVMASPSADRILFSAGDMRSLPFPDDAFDWAWSADCAGYPSGDLLPVLREFARVTRPGGTVAILAWTSQLVLPGHALLEARLNATCSAYAPHLQGQSPEAHFLRARRWFAEAGFTGVTMRTFVGDVQSPLCPGLRTALASLFEMLWGQAQPGASEADRMEYKRLCRAESPDFILNLPEYDAFFTYTMFHGRVTKRAR